LRESRGTLWSKAVILAFLVAPLVWAILYFVFKLPPGTLLQSLLGGQGPGGVQAPLQQKPGVWLWVVQAVLVYPVLEEIVFRGALQGWLLQRFKRTGSSAEANPGQLRHRLLHLVSLPNLKVVVQSSFCRTGFRFPTIAPGHRRRHGHQDRFCTPT